MTDSGRTVYGGGGISPDEQFVPSMTAFKRLARKYAFSIHQALLRQTRSQAAQRLVPDEKIWLSLHDFLLDQGFKFTEAELRRTTSGSRRGLQRECT